MSPDISPDVSTVRVAFSKWGDRPHWEYDAMRLGYDPHGTWLGLPSGTAMSRPGATFRTDQRSVLLVPPASPFVATFYADGGSSVANIYVDITTTPTATRIPRGDRENGDHLVPRGAPIDRG